MKKNIKLFGLFLALFAATGIYSCKENNVDPNIPTQLRVGSITSTGATLMWSGNAGSYNVEVNGQTATTETTSYTATGLTPSTSYTWRVRAVVGDGYSDWASGSFTTAAESRNFAVSVNFGNGEEVWDAVYVNAEEDSGYVWLYFSNVEEPSIENFTPTVELFVPISETTTLTYPENYDNGMYLEYFSENYWERAMSNEEETVLYGDWEVSEGTATITSYENSLISGTIDAIMFDSFDYWINESDNPVEKTLKVTFTDVPVSSETRAVQGARKFKSYTNQSRSVRK